MANANQKSIARQDRAARKKGLVIINHGPFAFHDPAKARTRLRSRSWKLSKRHPANIAVGQRKCGDFANFGRSATFAPVTVFKASPFVNTQPPAM